MKKILLSAMALVAAMSVNAQEFAAFNAEDNSDFAALGLNSDAVTAVVGGSVFGKTTNITAKAAFDDSFKSSSIGSITVGEATWNGGVQGNTNPKDADGGTPSGTLVAPAGGAAFLFEAAADGFLYIIQNSSSNKAYTVFEEGEAIGYIFSAYWTKAKVPAGKGVYSYELKGAGEYNQLKEAGITSVDWPEAYVIKDYDKANTTDSKGYGDGGLGVIKFPVFKDCKYIVNANGSKMTCSGFYFDTTGDADVTVKDGDDVIKILDAGKIPSSTPTAISTVKAINSNESVIYNVAGQQVSKDYKGLVIKNGKKMIQK